MDNNRGRQTLPRVSATHHKSTALTITVGLNQHVCEAPSVNTEGCKLHRGGIYGWAVNGEPLLSKVEAQRPITCCKEHKTWTTWAVEQSKMDWGAIFHPSSYIWTGLCLGSAKRCLRVRIRAIHNCHHPVRIIRPDDVLLARIIAKGYGPSLQDQVFLMLRVLSFMVFSHFALTMSRCMQLKQVLSHNNQCWM